MYSFLRVMSCDCVSGAHERGGTCVAPAAGALQLSGGGLLAADAVPPSERHL